MNPNAASFFPPSHVDNFSFVNILANINSIFNFREDPAENTPPTITNDVLYTIILSKLKIIQYMPQMDQHFYNLIITAKKARAPGFLVVYPFFCQKIESVLNGVITQIYDIKIDKMPFTFLKSLTINVKFKKATIYSIKNQIIYCTSEIPDSNTFEFKFGIPIMYFSDGFRIQVVNTTEVNQRDDNFRRANSYPGTNQVLEPPNFVLSFGYLTNIETLETYNNYIAKNTIKGLKAI